MTEMDALLVLNAIYGISNSKIIKLVKHFGSAIKILSLKPEEINELNIVFQSVSKNISDFPTDSFLKNEYNLIAKHKIDVISIFDNDYPSRLKEISDAPIVLYIKGNIKVIAQTSIALVGSRRASVYGISIAYKFASRLAEMGFNIVSGMALGVDTSSHRGALKSGGITTAVLGCGLSRVYPLDNKGLMNEISFSGAVISEFPMETEPFAYNFPKRNRIISGLSSGVIVIEAAQKSGALITADFALEQGREVYAVPGKVDSPTSLGVNNLIKQGAKLITCIEDVIEDISPQLIGEINGDQKKEGVCKNTISKVSFSETEKYIINKIEKNPVHIDELILECNNIAELNTILFGLELKGIIKQLPGKYFIRK